MIVVMSDEKATQIVIKSGKPTGLSSRAFGANIDGVAFNLEYIASKNPTLAAQIAKNYKEASEITDSTPKHPDEDFDLAFEDFKDLLN